MLILFIEIYKCIPTELENIVPIKIYSSKVNKDCFSKITSLFFQDAFNLPGCLNDSSANFHSHNVGINRVGFPANGVNIRFSILFVLAVL